MPGAALKAEHHTKKPQNPIIIAMRTGEREVIWLLNKGISVSCAQNRVVNCTTQKHLRGMAMADAN